MPYIKPLKGATVGHLNIHLLVLHDNTCVHKGNSNGLLRMCGRYLGTTSKFIVDSPVK